MYSGIRGGECHKNNRKMVALTTEIELNPGQASFPCGSCGVEVLYWMMIVPYLVTVVNIGTTVSARTYQLEHMKSYRQVTCPSQGCV